MPVLFDHQKYSLDKPDLIMPSIGGEAGLSRKGVELAKQLQRVGWEVDGITVKFRTTTFDDRIIRHLSSISGLTEDGPFELSFSNHGDRSTLCYATVPPGIEVSFHSDGSASAVLFLTDDWKQQGRRLIAASTYDARREGRPKEYLRYDAHYHEALRHRSSSDEYQPSGDEPTILQRDDIIARMTPFLDRLIAILESKPTAAGHDDVARDGDANLRRMAAIEETPVPGNMPVLYGWVNEDDVYGLKMAPEEEHATRELAMGTGTRLVYLGSGGGNKLHPRAYDGFVYAAENPRHATHHRTSRKEYSLPARIELKSLTEVYVVDNAAFMDQRAQLAVIAEAEGREEFTSEELALIETAVAKTIVPAKDYKGGFKIPCYAIGRRLLGDEARLLEGPIEASEDENGVRVTLTDETTGDVVTLYENERPIPYHRRQVVLTAERAAQSLHGRRDAYIDRLKGAPEPEPDVMAILGRNGA